MQLLGDVPAVLVGEGLAAQLYQQSAQLVLVLVQMVLVGAHPLGVLLVELVQQGEGAEDGILRQTGHLHGLAAALGNGHGGGGQQAGVDEGERGLAPLALLDHQIGQLFQLLGEGQEQDGGGDIEEAVDHSDPAGIDQGVHEGIVDEEAAAVEDQQARRRAAQVEENVDDGNPPGAAVDADTGEQSGGAGADILPHDDGQGHAVGDGAGHGEGLQDAHRGGGGLELKDCREVLLAASADGKEEAKYLGDLLLKLARQLTKHLIYALMANRAHYESDLAMEKIKGAIALFDLVCDDGNLGEYHDELIKLNLYLSRVQWERGDRDEAFVSLDEALRHARALERLSDGGEHFFTAPLVSFVQCRTAPWEGIAGTLPEDWPFWGMPECGPIETEIKADPRWGKWVRACKSNQ